MAPLTRRSGGSVVCLDLVEAPYPVRLSYERGHLLPINAGAAAAVLLAWEPEEEVTAILDAAPLESFTARTLTDTAELRKRLTRIRKDGVAVSQGELDEQILGVAAPIHDAKGSVTAAVSIAALASRVPRTQIKDMKFAVKRSAEMISQRLVLFGS